MADKTAILTKVRAMLDKAESTEFPAEAEAYRAKAEELMVKYRIEEEETIARDEFAILPVPFDIKLSGPSQYVQHYVNIFGNIARHTGVHVTYEWAWTEEGRYAYARGVGYQSDIDYTDMLFTQARMVFGERLEPKINPELSDQVNAYRLRSSGMERIRIAEIMWGNTDKVFLGRVGRLYKAECAQRGETPALSGRGVTGAAYREQYADQFVWTFYTRLRQARDAAGQAGGGLVLAGRQERINEAFYARFPHLRPVAEVEAAEPQKPCERCAKAKSGSCREHPAGRAPKGGRDYHSAAAVRGREAGAAAARAVELGRSGRTGSIGGS